MKYKDIIFFDGDGTLWYPRKTKRTIPPHWIYSDTDVGDAYLEYMMLTPGAQRTLLALKQTGMKLIALSTHPHSRREADAIMAAKINHFGLRGIFDEVHTSRNYPEGKGEAIVRILQRHGIPKSRTLMVGDNYLWDYLSAKRVGVDALLIRSDYMKNPRANDVIIEDLSEIGKKYCFRH